MQQNRGGFTIFEVLIVLAISALLFISAVALFRGKKGQTEFNQAMYDLESKVQSAVNDVKSGTFPDASNYNCTKRADDGTAGLMGASGPGTGKNQDCITLGRAIHAVHDSSTVYIYTVLGARLNDQNLPAKSILDANPSTMIGGNPQQDADLTEEYDLLGGASVVSSKVVGQAGSYDIIGYYLAPQGGSSAGQGSTFTGLGYNFDSTPPSNGPRSLNSQLCVKQDPTSSCINPITLGQWNLCLQSFDGGQKAFLSVTSAPSGVNTKLTFEDCS